MAYEEEKAALISGIKSIFAVWWIFRDNQPTTSFALFKIHESIEPMIPSRPANALSANSLNNCDKAFNLFFIHSLAPPFFLSPTTI